MSTSEHRTRGPLASRLPWRILLVPLLISVGIALAVWQPFEVSELLEIGRELSTRPWFIPAVILLMAALFATGLPGSPFIWIVAPFQAPWVAVPVMLAGSVLGAAGAWSIGSKLRGGWKPGRFGRRVMNLLDERSDILTQTALRVLPGFPHSVINFAGGILRLNLVTFLAAAVIGLAIKWGVYATAIHGAAEALETGQALSPGTVIPLIVLTGMLLIGSWVRSTVASGNGPGSPG